MKSWVRVFSIVSMALLLGCGEDTQIRSYTVAKKPSQTPQPEVPAQTLGVIFPNQDTAWFLKLMDDPAKVEPLTSEFRRLADSIEFDEQGKPRWKLADGWRDQVLEQITYAKFTHNAGATATLTKLAANTQDAEAWQAYLKENVNRWRDQLSLAPQEWSDMQEDLEEFPNHSTGPAKAYFVMLKGNRKSAGSGMGNAPFMDRMRAQAQAQSGSQPQTAPAQNTPAQTTPPESSPTDPNSASGSSASTKTTAPTGEQRRIKLTYEVPSDWTELPASGIRLASFQVQQQDQSATIVISTSTGKIPDAVGMWLQQIGQPAEQAKVDSVIQAATDGQLNNISYRCYRIADEEDKTLAIRVAVIPVSPTENLYVKLTGPSTLVEAQAATMDRFISSLNW